MGSLITQMNPLLYFFLFGLFGERMLFSASESDQGKGAVSIILLVGFIVATIIFFSIGSKEHPKPMGRLAVVVICIALAGALCVFAVFAALLLIWFIAKVFEFVNGTDPGPSHSTGSRSAKLQELNRLKYQIWDNLSSAEQSSLEHDIARLELEPDTLEPHDVDGVIRYWSSKR